MARRVIGVTRLAQSTSGAAINANFKELYDLVGSGGGGGGTGPKGDTGPEGPKGDTGPEGPKGDTGSPGIKGDTGSPGVKGEKGDTGPVDTSLRQLVNANKNDLSDLLTGTKDTVVAAVNELYGLIININKSLDYRTPDYYGCKGDTRYDLTASMTAGSAILTSPDAVFSRDDIGKTVMVARAGSSDDLVTIVSSFTNATTVTLAAAAATTVTAVKMHIGTDDKAKLQEWLDGCSADGVIAYVPRGRKYLCQQMPLRYNSGQSIKMAGDLVFGQGWGGAFAICDKIFGLVNAANYASYAGTNVGNVFIGEGGTIVLSNAAATATSGGRRKGLGVCFADYFYSSGISVKGTTDRDYFAYQPVYARRGIIIGGFMHNIGTTLQGADGIHFYGNCSDIHVLGMNTYCHDDGSSQTSESNESVNTTIRRIRYVNCSFRNVAHSGLKAYANGVAGASIIEDIEYHNCDFISEMDASGGALPISVFMDGAAYANGCRIRRFKIFGGVSDVVNPNNVTIPYGGRTAVSLNDCSEFEFYGHTIRSPWASAITAMRCHNLILNNVTIMHTRPIEPKLNGLVVSSIAYQSGTNTRVTFTTDISAAGIVATQWLLVAGAANADNNGGFRIESVGANYVDVRNYKRSTNALDETTTSATASIVVAANSSINLIDSNDAKIVNSKIVTPMGSGGIFISGSANDAAKFSDGTMIDGLEISDLLCGSAIYNYNAKNTHIRNTKLRRSRVDNIINEGSGWTATGGHRYFNNIDFDKLAAAPFRKNPAITVDKTVNSGNMGRTSDYVDGTVNQTSGTNTFNISIPLSCDHQSLINTTHLIIPPVIPIQSITYDSSNKRFTVTTTANASATLTWNYVVKQP